MDFHKSASCVIHQIIGKVEWKTDLGVNSEKFWKTALEEIDKMSYQYICSLVRVTVKSIQFYLASQHWSPGIPVVIMPLSLYPVKLWIP